MSRKYILRNDQGRSEVELFDDGSTSLGGIWSERDGCLLFHGEDFKRGSGAWVSVNNNRHRLMDIFEKPPSPKRAKGPVGDVIMRWLSWVWLKPKACKCKDLADRMNSLGPDYCLKQIDTLSDEMAVNARVVFKARREAVRQRLKQLAKRYSPLKVACRVLIRLACWRARRIGSSENQHIERPV